MEITFERCLEGYIVWRGALKVGVLNTKHNQGLMRNGVVIWEPQPRSDWGLYFTSPNMPVALIEAIMKALPTEA